MSCDGCMYYAYIYAIYFTLLKKQNAKQNTKYIASMSDSTGVKDCGCVIVNDISSTASHKIYLWVTKNSKSLHGFRTPASRTSVSQVFLAQGDMRLKACFQANVSIATQRIRTQRADQTTSASSAFIRVALRSMHLSDFVTRLAIRFVSLCDWSGWQWKQHATLFIVEN